ncbi:MULTISPECIES: phosphate ABC transporter permease PstA [unclassified Paenibacillus]|uniref:phosphate ABC transporter permease PstA n=1 Tax=unclassified Paenibacillus TaxID=185978 RepID=UPI0004156447|nr:MULTISPECIES: phosphate ABC transporter permease PstA [unclassified Paenibacillus]KGP85146.1 phosphate ABC transporter permease [Paenibacillus sp. MAEPY2]KGP88175.1 phosphate ABC transporter permease [Paenibacillus sp. MAEPY1]
MSIKKQATPVPTYSFAKRRSSSMFMDKLFTGLVWGIGIIVILFIVGLLFLLLEKGLPLLSWDFLYGVPSEIEEGGGIGPALFNSFYVLILSLLISIPIGMAAGIYLAEFAPNNKLMEIVRICVEGLSSVPSIIFGLFGIALFVEYFEIGLTILGAAVSLAFLNLPVLTRVTEESIKAVPVELRNGSFALGSTHLQTIRHVLLPVALNGIMTGICLTAGRAFGESAVIILTAGVSTSGEMWDFNLLSPGGTLAVHLWYIQSEAIVPDAEEIAQKATAVLIFVALLINILFRVPLWLNARKTQV